MKNAPSFRYLDLLYPRPTLGLQLTVIAVARWQHWNMFKFKETVELLKLIKAVVIWLSRRSCLQPCHRVSLPSFIHSFRPFL